MGGHYTLEQLRNAVSDVVEKRKSYRAASAAYKVPVTVIFNRIKGRQINEFEIGKGRRTDIPRDVEEKLAKCLLARAEMGFPCDKRELKTLVQEYITKNGLTTRFKDNMPGDKWYYGFMKRHPRLTLKKPEHLQKARKSARDPFVVYDFFDQVSDIYSTTSLSPELVFNTDETGFASDPNRLRGIGEKSVPLNRISDGSGRESTSVLACVSADGCCLPPLVVFKGKAVQPRWISADALEDTMYAATANGWMEECTFHQWFKLMFTPHVAKVRLVQQLADSPAILFLDGHSSHISIRIIELAIENNIKIIKFPSHLTDRLQPLDKCVFGPVKTEWNKILVEHGKSKMGDGPSRLSKSDFGALLKKVWPAITPTNVRRGFETTGIFPLNREKIPETWFCPIQLKRYKAHLLRNNHTHQLEPIITVETRQRIEEIPVGAAGDGIIEEGPLDLSMPRREDGDEDSVKITTRDIIKVFSEALVKRTGEPAAGPSPRIAVGTRLKHHTYGEVLTSQQVMERLTEAEKSKGSKRPLEGSAKRKPGRPKKSKSTPDL